MDGNSSDVVTKTYNIGSIQGFWVYFKPPTSWTVTPRVYWWNVQPSDAMPTASWPGEQMLVHDSQWYKYHFDGVSSTNLIFNDGNPNGVVDVTQTPDITGITEEIWYEWGVGILDVNTPEINLNTKIYPNPADSFIRVEADVPFSLYKIFDAQGRLVLKGEIKNQNIDVSRLSNGKFILELQDKDQHKKTIRFIK